MHSNKPSGGIKLFIFHLLRYLSVIWVLGCELVQSRVWLLTLTFIGGSGGEGSADRDGQRKLLLRQKWQELSLK